MAEKETKRRIGSRLCGIASLLQSASGLYLFHSRVQNYRCLSADVLVSLCCSIELDWIHSVCLQGCLLGMQEVILF
jgi:hypothetical protein